MKAAFLLSILVTIGFAQGCIQKQQGPRESHVDNDSKQSYSPVRYDAAAFFKTNSFLLSAGYAWSRDDSQLLIGSDENGTFNVYTLSPVTGKRVALTSSILDAQFPVSWFPQDDRVLISADSGGDELNHLYVREVDGTIRDLTPGAELKASFGGWSQDQNSFFVLTNERDSKAIDIYRYDTQSYERELVFQNDHKLIIAGVSPDQRYLALIEANSSADTDLYLLELGEAEPLHITPHEGNVSHGVAAFARDSRSLLYLTDEHGEFAQAWHYDIATGVKQMHLVADWDVAFVFFSESGKYQISGVNNDGRTEITITDTNTNATVDLPELPEGDLAQIRFSRDERKLALMVTSDTSPRDVFTIDMSAGRSQRLTKALNPEIDEANLVQARVVRFPSFDGLPIPGILYQPKGATAANPAPAVVWVHGGPGGQSRLGYSATLQHLVNHGYTVLAANNRGSSGYGKTFFHLDDRRHGEVDLDDILYAKRYLQTLDWVDGERIGIMGGSYGGYMVGAALAFHPTQFKVGVDIFGVMNWIRTLESIPPWWEQQRKALYDEMGDPGIDQKRLRRISPLFHADKIQTPLLVVQGANDPRVLQVESDEIVAAVRSNGVPVEYLVFPDEGHGFTKRNNRISASSAYVSFLRKYL